MADGVTRRDWLAATTVGLGGAIVASSLQASPEQGEATVANSSGPFRVCFNTSTIRGQKLTVDKQIAIAIQAGYEGIEPWIGDLRAFVEGAGSSPISANNSMTATSRSRAPSASPAGSSMTKASARPDSKNSNATWR